VEHAEEKTASAVMSAVMSLCLFMLDVLSVVFSQTARCVRISTHRPPNINLYHRVTAEAAG
jgi:hypothetical protein